MDRKIIAVILAFTALALVVGIFIPGGDAREAQILPWEIESTQENSIRVFGLTLGQSNVHLAENLLRSPAKLSLFTTPDRTPVVEAFFDNVNLGGLSAQMVMQIDVPQAQLQTLLQQGERISALPGRARKVTLSDADAAAVRRLPISGITYLPRVRLQPGVIRQRFGEPAQRITEAENSTVHWLYPAMGLDIALDEQGRAVLQYVPPSQFERLREPLGTIKRPEP